MLATPTDNAAAAKPALSEHHSDPPPRPVPGGGSINTRRLDTSSYRERLSLGDGSGKGMQVPLRSSAYAWAMSRSASVNARVAAGSPGTCSRIVRAAMSTSGCRGGMRLAFSLTVVARPVLMAPHQELLLSSRSGQGDTGGGFFVVVQGRKFPCVAALAQHFIDLPGFAIQRAC